MNYNTENHCRPLEATEKIQFSFVLPKQLLLELVPLSWYPRVYVHFG